VVTYQVRIVLEGTDPPLWRGVELASDLFLDQVHDIIQVAFGWTDSHLHRFASGPDRLGAGTEHYLCPFDVDEGDIGLAEGHVRLDEVLAEPGDQLFYSYDYGDDWQHVLVLEGVLARAPGSGWAVCTGGERPGPVEDCGGAHIYQLAENAVGRGTARRAEAAAELAEIFGSDLEIGLLAGAAFDRDQINGALSPDWGPDVRPAGSGRPRPLDLSVLPPPLADVLDLVRTSGERRMLRRLIDSADLGSPVLIDAATAARMVRPYAWLLDRVGEAGIKLTAAGYLPPAHVAAAVAELALGDEWIGAGNRENQTLPVLDLRETAQHAGLVRRYSGKLQITARGRAMRSDPVALWWRLAEAMPAAKDACERQAGLLLLVMMAASMTTDCYEEIAGLLTAIGWQTSYGEPLTSSAASHAAWSTGAVLRRVGAFATGPSAYARDQAPTKEGAAFARAALLTWPPVRPPAASR
jgi:Plasmid pRiA4b ORF-3-like protein